MSSIKATLNLLCTVALFVLFACCNNRLDRPLHFELPDGYSGPFLLMRSPLLPALFSVCQTSIASRFHLLVSCVFPMLGFSTVGILRVFHTSAARIFQTT